MQSAGIDPGLSHARSTKYSIVNRYSLRRGVPHASMMQPPCSYHLRRPPTWLPRTLRAAYVASARARLGITWAAALAADCGTDVVRFPQMSTCAPCPRLIHIMDTYISTLEPVPLLVFFDSGAASMAQRSHIDFKDRGSSYPFSMRHSPCHWSCNHGGRKIIS